MSGEIQRKYRISDGTYIYLKMHSPDQILKEKGLASDGEVQSFHTNNVLNRITKYMPYRTGMTIKVTVNQTNINKPVIITNVPYGKFLFYGKLMVDPVTGAAGFLTKKGWRSRKEVPKVRSERDITYTQDFNPLAGPFWDRRLVSAEMPAMVADLQAYINRRRKR